MESNRKNILFHSIELILQSRQSIFSNILNILFVIYALLLPFSNAFSTFTGPVLLLLFWIFEGNFDEKIKKIRSEKAIFFWLIFFGLNLLSLLWSANISEGMHTLKYYFAITVTLIVFYTSLKPRFITHVLIAFLLSMFISEILLYGVFWEWWTFEKSTPTNPSPIMHHIIYSIFVATTIFFLLWQLFDPRVSRNIKILESFFLLSTTANLFLNGGRTGQLAFLFAIFVFISIYYGFKKKYIALTLLAVFFLFFSAYKVSPVFNKRVHEGISDVQRIIKGDLNNSWGLRIAMKIVSLEIIKNHPAFGVGIGDILDEFQTYRADSEMKKYDFLKKIIHVHDQFLQTTIQTGIIGLFLFVAFLYYLFNTTFSDPLTKAVFCAILTVFLFSFFTDVPLRNYTSGLFGFVIGFLMAKNRIDILLKKRQLCR